MEKKEPKFKVGDWVTMKGIPQDEMFHILEVNQQICEAGIVQVRYLGRHFFRSRLEIVGVKETKSRWAMSVKEFQVREMELGELTTTPS